MKVILICILICLQLANFGQSLRMASSYNPKWSVSKCRQVFGQNCERKPSWFVCNCNSNCFSKNTLFLENSLPGTVSNPAMCQMRCKYTKGCKVNLRNFMFYTRLGLIWSKLSDSKSSETTFAFWHKVLKNTFGLILLLKKVHCQRFEVYIVTLLNRKP